MSSHQDEIIVKGMNGEDITVNKSKFMKQSPLLNAMISFPDITSTLILKLPLPPDQVAQSISFTESENPNLVSIENAMEIYKMSTEYQMKNLQIFCQDFLLKNMNDENVCGIHDFACQYANRLIQYQCWRRFDVSWKEIFKTENFMKCRETTILRLVSRPIYNSMTEYDIFKAVYRWAKYMTRNKSEQEAQQSETIKYKSDSMRYRQAMQPFLPFIRFLTIHRSILENCIFNQNILTREEIQGISLFKKTKDKSKLTKTICDKEDERTESAYHSLFKYITRDNLDCKYGRQMKRDHVFFSEIIVYADCFATQFNLPTTHDIEEGLKFVFGKRIGDSQETAFKNTIVTCTGNGVVILEEPVYLEKNSKAIFTLRTADPMTVYFSSIIVVSEADYYISKKERSTLMKNNDLEEIMSWTKFYFDVFLYF